MFNKHTIVLLLMFPLNHMVTCLLFTGCCLLYGSLIVRLVTVAYLTWIVFDRSPAHGGYKWCEKYGIQAFLRNGIWWKLCGGHIPFSLYPTAEIDTKKPHMFVCHPHGIIGCAAMGHFGTNMSGLTSKVFPGLKVHLVGLKPIFKIPLFREFCMAHGHATPGRNTITNILTAQKSVALVVGGAKESLDAHPGTMRLTLKDRKGFVKLALQNKDTHLVPVLTFGENELYSMVPNPKGSFIRKLQDSFQHTFGFALPMFCGEWWCPLMPKGGVPLHTYIGKPLSLPYIPTPTNEDINKYHTQYLDSLTGLFNAHKVEAGYSECVLEYV